jgi:putative transcriptional regulator
MLQNFFERPVNTLDPARGRLLIADPFMDDPYFRRTVVLLCEHNEDSSFGFVLNKYIDADLEDLVDEFPAIEGRVSLGGPVENSNLFFIHNLGPDLVPDGQEILPGLYLGGDFDRLRELVRGGDANMDNVRFFVGYSGWSEHQLDGEIAQEAWYVSELNALPLFDTAAKDLWEQAIRNMGPAFTQLSNYPSDPSLN